MNQSSVDNLMQPYRSYSWAIPRFQFDRQLKGRLEVSDIVQQSLLPRLYNRTHVVLVAWLRQILASVLTDEIRFCRRAKRNVASERALATDLAQSAAGTEPAVAGLLRCGLARLRKIIVQCLAQESAGH
jgi:hypothetical protein